MPAASHRQASLTAAKTMLHLLFPRLKFGKAKILLSRLFRFESICRYFGIKSACFVCAVTERFLAALPAAAKREYSASGEVILAAICIIELHIFPFDPVTAVFRNRNFCWHGLLFKLLFPIPNWSLGTYFNLLPSRKNFLYFSQILLSAFHYLACFLYHRLFILIIFDLHKVYLNIFLRAPNSGFKRFRANGKIAA